MKKSTKSMSISKHLHTDLQAEFFAILNLAGDNPNVIKNREEVKARWTKMIESITTVDDSVKETAIMILNNPDKVVLASMTSYYLGTSSAGVSYNTTGRYSR